MNDSEGTAPGATGGRLLQVLGLAFGLAVLVGNTIGMGILRTPGVVAEKLPSVPLFMGAWIVGAVYALLGALSLAELGAMHPRSGGQYPLVRRALGPYPGFLTGWTDWISTCGSTAAVAMVLAEYLGPLIPVLSGKGSLIAILIVTGFGLLQWRGIKIGDAVQQATSLVKGVSLIGLAVVALIVSSGSERAPAASSVAAIAVPTGFLLVSAIIVALQSVIFTFDGWTAPLYFGEEVKDAAREIPRSMIAGVLLVLGIYLALNFAFLQAVPIQEMAGDPFVAATVASRLFGPTGDTVLRILMIISLLASVNALQLMASRVPFAMARDGLLPGWMSKVNVGGTPTSSLLFSTILAAGFIGTNSFDTVLAILAFFFVANYALSFCSVFVLRRREPDTPRPFRIPGYPWVPGVALVGSIAFLIAAVQSDLGNSWKALVLIGISVPAYFMMKAER